MLQQSNYPLRAHQVTGPDDDHRILVALQQIPDAKHPASSIPEATAVKLNRLRALSVLYLLQ